MAGSSGLSQREKEEKENVHPEADGGVDADIRMGVDACADAYQDQDQHMGGPPHLSLPSSWFGFDRYVEYAMHRVRLLRHHGIAPYLVFDGGPLPAKKGTKAERAQRRAEALARGDALAAQGRHAQAREHYVKCVDVTPQMAYQLIKVRIPSELRIQKSEIVLGPRAGRAGGGKGRSFRWKIRGPGLGVRVCRVCAVLTPCVCFPLSFRSIARCALRCVACACSVTTPISRRW